VAFEDRKTRAIYPYIGGSPVIFSIPPGGKVLAGRLTITGNLVVTGGTTNGVALGEGGPIGLVKRIQVTANRNAASRYPGGKIVDCTPRSLLRYAITQHNGKFVGELSGSTIGNGAAGTYPIYLSIPIYFADTTLRNQVQTALNMDFGVYSSVQVQVDLANDLTGCFTGNDRVCNFSGLTVQWNDERLGIAGDTVPLFQEDHLMLIATTFQRAQDMALPLDGAFTQWLLLAEASAARTLADTLLNRVTITGPTLNFDEYGLDIRQKMFDDEWFDPAQSAIGHYFIDFTEGLLQNSNAAAGLLAQFDVNNVSGANLDQIRFYTRRIFTLAPAQ
jgi:hypothetical protein